MTKSIEQEFVFHEQKELSSFDEDDEFDGGAADRAPVRRASRRASAAG